MKKFNISKANSSIMEAIEKFYNSNPASFSFMDFLFWYGWQEWMSIYCKDEYPTDEQMVAMEKIEASCFKAFCFNRNLFNIM